MKILIAVAVTLGLAACGGGGASDNTTSSSSSGSGAQSGTGTGTGTGTTAATATYTLSWDAVTSTSSTTVTGYRIYYGTAPLTSQSPLGMIDTTLTSLDFNPEQHSISRGNTLYVAVSALGSNGVESPVSQTVSVVVE